MVNSTQSIYIILDKEKIGHQSTIVEVEGKIKNHPLSILVDPKASHSYVTPRIEKVCSLRSNKHKKDWLV